MAHQLFGGGIRPHGEEWQLIMRDAVEASAAEVVTASIRRVSLQGHVSDTVKILKGKRFLESTRGRHRTFFE